MPKLFIKDETCQPTGSLKDRASLLVAGVAREYDIGEVVLASTGNAASSMAGVGAYAGLGVTLFLPQEVPRAKLVQSLQYGAQIRSIEGGYDEAYDQAINYAHQHGALCRNTGYNPMTIEGKKTTAIEIVQQLGGRPPDHLFVATGDGVIISGLYKGFLDLQQLGLIHSIPILHAVQSSGSRALARAFDSGHFERNPVETVADSIAVEVPRNGLHALRRLHAYGGKVVVVSDDAILDAQSLMSRLCGLFAEPAGAAALAGIIKQRAEIDYDAVVVMIATGSGLKDIEAAAEVLST